MPLIYVLAVDKRYETYKQIFEELLKLKPTIKPSHITVDFEKAAIKALKNAFPDSSIHGCNFHFSQNVWRHIQSLGLQRIYSEDAVFGLNLRLLLALPFVPIQDVERAFSEIVGCDFSIENEGAEHNDSIQLLLNYVETTYIGRFDRAGVRKPGLFPIEFWNVHDLTLSGIVIFHFSCCIIIFHFSFLIISNTKSIHQACHEPITASNVGTIHCEYLLDKLTPTFTSSSKIS